MSKVLTYDHPTDLCLIRRTVLSTFPLACPWVLYDILDADCLPDAASHRSTMNFILLFMLVMLLAVAGILWFP
jgi:hypothetical protein